MAFDVQLHSSGASPFDVHFIDEVTTQPDFITSAAQVFALAVSADVALDHIASVAQVFEHSLFLRISVPAIPSQAQIYDITVSVDLVLEHLSSKSVVFDPELYPDAAGTVVGTGELFGSGSVDFAGSGAASGLGDLQGNAVIEAFGVGYLEVAGVLEGTGVIEIYGLGTLLGECLLRGDAVVDRYGSGDVSSVGELSGAAVSEIVGEGILQAEGELEGSGQALHGGPPLSPLTRHGRGSQIGDVSYLIQQSSSAPHSSTKVATSLKTTRQSREVKPR